MAVDEQSAWPRFSIKFLFAAVTCCALAIVALVNASPVLLGVLWLVLFVIYLVAGLAAIFRRGPQQAFAAGFVIAGLAFLVWINGSSNSNFPTTRALSALYKIVARETPNPRANPITGGRATLLEPPYSVFRETGNDLCSLLVALLGGLLARYFYVTRDNVRR